MRKLIIILFVCLLTMQSRATTYYISNAGSTGNSGTSTGAPWPFSKVNSFTFAAGDNILFNRGEIFYGAITVNQSGTSGNPITFGAYGTGAKPIISGLTTLSGWSAYNSNIQQAALAAGHVEVVLIDGVPTGRGRWPNSGFYTYTVVTSQASISDATHLTGTPNWTGAELVMRKSEWTLSRDSITNQATSTVSFAAGSNWETMTSGYGYFIQNSLATLDTMNEWYADGSNFFIWLGGGNGSSHTVQVSTIKKLVSMDTRDYVTFDNLQIQGADSLGIYIQNSGHITVQNCDFNYNGKYAVYTGYNSHDVTITGNTYRNSYCNAISICGANYPISVVNNQINKTGVIMGTGAYGAGSGDFDFNGDGIVCYAPHSIIKNNVVDSSNHIGIRISALYDTILNNSISHAGLIRNDVGGIYAWAGDHDLTGSLMQGNVIESVLGNFSGMPAGTVWVGATGVYTDYARNMKVLGNSVNNVQQFGILLNGPQNIEVHDNTAYAAGDASMEITERSGDRATGVNITRNKFIAKDSINTAIDTRNHIALMFYTDTTVLQNIGTLDSNIYAHPVNETSNKVATYINSTWTSRTLSNWQSYSGKDAATVGSVITAPNTSYLKFVSNVTTATAATSLSYKYEDVTGTQYNSGTISLSPYSSAVLVQIGSLAFHGPFPLRCNCSVNGIKAN
ncbi:MAG: right-handed parallel beta-helix repeat-containing protein [Bacteroidota bacterium]|nr:right-handed parallel beta-helix repeat-containing protein [Bacteroidota bacterium]